MGVQGTDGGQLQVSPIYWCGLTTWPCSVQGLTGQPGLGAWRRDWVAVKSFNTHNVNKVSTKNCSKKPKNGFISKFLNALGSDPFCIMLAFLKRKQLSQKHLYQACVDHFRTEIFRWKRGRFLWAAMSQKLQVYPTKSTWGPLSRRGPQCLGCPFSGCLWSSW